MHVVNINAPISTNETNAVPTKISEILGDNSSAAMNRTTAFVGIQGAEYQFSHYVSNTYIRIVCTLYPIHWFQRFMMDALQ